MSKKKKINKPEVVVPKPTKRKLNPILEISLKFGTILLIVGLTIQHFDSTGYFNPNNVNNHTKKKWDAYYEFTKENNVDVLLIGNSHLYTGINPKNLSNALGANSFILASPGTNAADYYYSLEEAIESSKPQLVIIETYGINLFNPYELKESALSDQFKSFAARKNTRLKLASTPYLFKMENYLYAWSNTIRNHDYLYTNPKQLEKNVELYEKEKYNPSKKKFYLGRYIRFQTGLTDSLVNLYTEKGAPVDGASFETNEYTKLYVDKIKNLCEVNGINVIFLTLPMYEAHVSNYNKWKDELSKLIEVPETEWLDMQDSIHYQGFDKNSFENTYNINQHMTYPGSLLATYKLANYIRSNNYELVNRKTDAKWRKMFQGEEGFYQNNDCDSTDTKCNIVYKRELSDTNSLNVVNSIVLVRGTKNYSVIARINKDSLNGADLTKKALQVNATVKMANGTTPFANINMLYDRFHSLDDNLIFYTKIMPIEILKVNQFKFIEPTPPAVDTTKTALN